MHFKDYLLALAAAFNAATVLADGCSQCGGFDVVDIDNGCRANCGTAFASTLPEYTQCLSQCDKIVLQGSCCTTSICTDTKRLARGLRSTSDETLSLEDLKRDESLISELSLAVRDEPYNQLQSTKELRSLSKRLEGYTLIGDEDALEARDGMELDKRDGASCCSAANALCAASNLCPNRSASMALYMACLAAKTACARQYQVVC